MFPTDKSRSPMISQVTKTCQLQDFHRNTHARQPVLSMMRRSTVLLEKQNRSSSIVSWT